VELRKTVQCLCTLDRLLLRYLCHNYSASELVSEMTLVKTCPAFVLLFGGISLEAIRSSDVAVMEWPVSFDDDYFLLFHVFLLARS